MTNESVNVVLTLFSAMYFILIITIPLYVIVKVIGFLTRAFGKDVRKTRYVYRR